MTVADGGSYMLPLVTRTLRLDTEAFTHRLGFEKAPIWQAVGFPSSLLGSLLPLQISYLSLNYNKQAIEHWKHSGTM